jgi:anti-sigma B factor antagonist
VDVWFSPSGNTVVVTPRGELDLLAAERLRTALLGTLTVPVVVVVDLVRVPFVDSTVVGVLIAASNRARAQRQKLVVVNPQPQIARTFSILGVTSMFAGSWGEEQAVPAQADAPDVSVGRVLPG